MPIEVSAAIIINCADVSEMPIEVSAAIIIVFM